MSPTLKSELRTVSFSSETHRYVKVERRAGSQRRCARGREAAVEEPLRAHGAQQRNTYAPERPWRPGRQQTTQVTDSLFLTRHRFLRPLFNEPRPPRTKLRLTRETTNERARSEIWREMDVVIGGDV